MKPIRRLLGTKNGKKVYANYYQYPSGLPELYVSGKYVARGSSLGPANWLAKPSKADINYWKEIARDSGLID